MKQSNLVLGIGIIVAVILIIGSAFLSTGSSDKTHSTSQTQSASTINQSIKNLSLVPFQVIVKQFSKIP
jgi:hypothetical protein